MPIAYQRLVDHHKLDPKELKKLFEVDGMAGRPKVKELCDMIRDCIKLGVERNRRDYRLYKALDWAYDQPFSQVTMTQLRGLIESGPDDKAVLSAIQSWGLTHLLVDALDENGKCIPDPVNRGCNKKAINLPVFFNIFVPICMAYHTIRWAKLFDERNQTPHFKYEPVQNTKENRIRCELVTQAIQKQSTWFNYPADTKQTLFNMLQYGVCINFPKEAWYSEKQEDENGKVVIAREGLRFEMPHPSRMYWDTFSRLSTLNTGTGCAYAGHWSLRRYQDIFNNPLYWNKDRIQIGASSWFDIGGCDFLKQVYPCQMTFPEKSLAGAGPAAGIGGVGPLDRESLNAHAGCYGAGNYNNAVLETQHFHRLVPSEWGMGKYDHPVFFRFVVGAENTVLYAEPLAFDRLAAYAYDADFNRSKFRSLTLEVMPFQDALSNALSHWILAVKQNLTNPIFYDKEQIPIDVKRELENLGQKQFSGQIWVPFSSTQNYKTRMATQNALWQPQLARHNTGELSSLISGILSILDRVLGFPPQEVGQAASHEQTAEENRITDRNVSIRVGFTGTFVDEGDYAKKRMLYDASVAHGSDEMVANISSSITQSDEEFRKIAKTMGVEILDGDDFNPDDPEATYRVKVKKNSLRLEDFASTRDGVNRINLPAIADAMSKIFTAIANQPLLIQSIGAPQFVELLNQIIVTAGLPREFKLKGKAVDMTAPEEQQAQQAAAQTQETANQLAEYSKLVKQSIDEASQQTLEASAQQTTEIVGAAIAQLSQQIGQSVQQVSEIVAKGAQVDAAQEQKLNELGGAVAQLQTIVAGVVKSIPPPPQPPAPVQASPLAPVTVPG